MNPFLFLVLLTRLPFQLCMLSEEQLSHQMTEFVRQSFHELCSLSAKTCAVVDLGCSSYLHGSVRLSARATFFDFTRIHKPLQRMVRYEEIDYDLVGMYSRGQVDGPYIVLLCHPSLHVPGPCDLLELATAHLIRSLALPFGRTVDIVFTTRAIEDVKFVKYRPWSEAIVVLNSTCTPSIWTRQSSLKRMYSKELNMHLTMGSRDLVKVTNVQNLFARIGTLDISCKPFPSPCALRNRDNVSERVEVSLTRGESSNPADRNLKGIRHRSIIGYARVPDVSKSGQVIRQILYIELWLFLIPLACAVARFHGQHFGRQLYLVLASVWTPIELTGWRHGQIAVGIWALLVQVLAYSFRANIVTSLQALPEDRIRLVYNCSHLGNRKVHPDRTLAEIGFETPSEVVLYSLQYLVAGSVVCWRPEFMPRLKAHLFPRLNVYQVAVKEPPYLIDTIDQFSVAVIPNTRFRLFAYYATTSWNSVVRFVQLFFAHGVAKRDFRHPFDPIEAEKHLSMFWKRPLAETYGEAVCQYQSNKRCFTADDLVDTSTGLVVKFRDVFLVFQIVAIGLALAICVYMIERFACTRLENRSKNHVLV